MSKNLTLKGAAFGALVALSISAVAPASAAGLADTSYVSLAPTAGTAYATIAESGAEFSLTANEATSVAGAGRNLKFLVTDADAAIEPVQSSTLKTVTLSATGGSWARSSNVVTVTAVAHGLSTGERIYVSASNFVKAATTDDVAAGYYVVTRVDADNFTFDSDIDSSDDVASGKFNDDTTSADTTVKVTRGGRAADNSYVVNSGAATDASNEVLKLTVAGNTTRTATVTAWVDANGNDTIDSTEYVSPTRTVTFKKYSEVVPSLTWTPVLVGDENVVVKVSTEPKLNWNQISAGLIEVGFGRQGSSATLAGGTESWSDTTGLWTITRALKETDRTAVNWTALKTPAVTPFTNSSTPAITHYAQSGSTATFTTGAAHNLSVNDRITVSTFLASAAEAKVTAVSEFTFSYTTTATEATTAKTAISTNAPSVALNSFGYATAGAYTAAVKIGTALDKIGSTFSSSAAASTAAAVSNKATVGANVTSGFAVRKGYTGDVVVTTTVKNSSGVAVGAGVPVSIAVTEGSAGTVVVNGTTITSSKTLDTTTNASGQVVITTTNSTAAAGDTVQLSVSSQGFNDTDTLTWAAAVYTLADDLDPIATDTNDARVVAKNGTVKFNLAVRDQFNSLLTTSARVAVALAGTRWSSTSYEALTGGKATVTITDAPVDVTDLTGQVTFTVQTQDAAGSWIAADGNTDVVTDFARDANDLDAQAVTVNVLGANGSKVVLNADAVASADLSAPVATTATAASDTRVLGQVATAFSATVDESVNITGKVVDSFTEVAEDGHTVTVSGASNILFRVGKLSAFGSLTFVSGSNGDFAVEAYSNAAQKDAVITVTSNGVSSTVKVSFTGVSTDLKKMTVTPGSTTYVPGQTVVYTIKLTDELGNPVDTAAAASPATAAYITVTYAGPGLVSGSLPVETDASGEATVRIATGTADTAAAVLTVKYDQNFDGDVADTNDLTVSSSVAASNPAASIATLTVTAATTSQAGRAVDVTVKAVDAAGAAVAGATVALSSVGAGSLASSSAVTNASGVAVVKLVAGASDLGSAVVTATANAKSGSATVEFGATDATVDIIGKRVYVTTEFAAGKRVTIYDNGVRRYSAIQTSDAEKVVMWNVKSGSHTIVVKISGASSDTVTFLVK